MVCLDILQWCRQHLYKMNDQQTLTPTIFNSPKKDKELAKSSNPRPQSDHPVYANFASSKLTIGAGVAIFHIASARVVLCWHSRDKYWFLPKGRRDAGEDSGAGAEREGFEEVHRILRAVTVKEGG